MAPRGHTQVCRPTGAQQIDPAEESAYHEVLMKTKQPEVVTDNLPYGPVLREWRNASDLTREQVAVALGVSSSTVARWETGKTAVSLTAVLLLERQHPGLVRDLQRCYDDWVRGDENRGNSRHRRSKKRSALESAAAE